jgi:hypothetical protein
MCLLCFLVITIGCNGLMNKGESKKAEIGVSTPIPQLIRMGAEQKADNINCKTYFPSGVFSTDPEYDLEIATWYSTYLSAMKEPSLCSSLEPSCTEVYRFLYLPSGSLPIAVRIQKCSSTYSIYYKKLTGNTVKDPGKLDLNLTTILTEEEWNKFNSYLTVDSFWNLKGREVTGRFDTARWIIEANKNGKYHIVDQESPVSGKLWEGCIYLIKISRGTSLVK